MQNRIAGKEVSEIVRRNVKQVIQALNLKGPAYEQVLLNQYLQGQKSQYEFLLPKSKHYAYYQQQLASQIPIHRQRKTPSFIKAAQSSQQQQLSIQQKPSQTIKVLGRVEEVSVGAMCELIKQLRQNKQPYEPFDNQIYEQQITLNLDDQNLNTKVSHILDMVAALKVPKMQKNVFSPERPQQNNSLDLLRSQLGTEKDGSLGGWGGKKYEGLGMRDQFTNYRRQTSKNFYQSTPR